MYQCPHNNHSTHLIAWHIHEETMRNVKSIGLTFGLDTDITNIDSLSQKSMDGSPDVMDMELIRRNRLIILIV